MGFLGCSGTDCFIVFGTWVAVGLIGLIVVDYWFQKSTQKTGMTDWEIYLAMEEEERIERKKEKRYKKGGPKRAEKKRKV